MSDKKYSVNFATVKENPQETPIVELARPPIGVMLARSCRTFPSALMPGQRAIDRPNRAAKTGRERRVLGTKKKMIEVSDVRRDRSLSRVLT
jgi:hypothetical protein